VFDSAARRLFKTASPAVWRRETWLERASLCEAIRASIAIPGFLHQCSARPRARMPHHAPREIDAGDLHA